MKAKPTMEKKSKKSPLHAIISVLVNEVVRQWNDDMIIFVKEGRNTIQDWCSFIFCLINVCQSCVYVFKYVYLVTTVSQKSSQINAENRRELLYFQLESLKSIASCKNGILDTDITFPVLFSLLSSTLQNIVQLDLIIEEGPTLQYYIKDLQKIFTKEEQKESFIVCSNIIQIFVMKIDSSILINECNSLLLKWLNSSDYTVSASVVSFITIFFINLRLFETLGISNPSHYKLDSQLKLILNFVKLLERNEMFKTASNNKKQFTEDYVLSVIQCVYHVIFITYKSGNIHHELLKECFDIALSAHKECLQWLVKIGKRKNKNREYLTSLFCKFNLCQLFISSA